MLAESTIRSLNKHAEFCQRAVTLRGRPRELMVALGEADELFFRLYPQHYRALQLVRLSGDRFRPPGTMKRRGYAFERRIFRKEWAKANAA